MCIGVFKLKFLFLKLFHLFECFALFYFLALIKCTKIAIATVEKLKHVIGNLNWEIFLINLKTISTLTHELMNLNNFLLKINVFLVWLWIVKLSQTFCLTYNLIFFFFQFSISFLHYRRNCIFIDFFIPNKPTSLQELIQRFNWNFNWGLSLVLFKVKCLKIILVKLKLP